MIMGPDSRKAFFYTQTFWSHNNHSLVTCNCPDITSTEDTSAFHNQNTKQEPVLPLKHLPYTNIFMCDTNLRDLVDFRCNEMHQFHITCNPWDVRKWKEMSSLKVLKLPWSKSEPYSKCKPSNLSQLGRDTASRLNGWNCSLPLSLSLSVPLEQPAWQNIGQRLNVGQDHSMCVQRIKRYILTRLPQLANFLQ